MSANIETQYVVNGKIFKSEEDARNYIAEVEREKARRETLQKEKQNRIKEIQETEEKLNDLYGKYSADYGTISPFDILMRYL